MHQNEEYYTGSIGDVEDINFGDIAIGDPEYAEMLAGAPIAKVMQRKMATRGQSKPSNAATAKAVLAVPGNAIQAAKLQSLYIENGKIVQNAATAEIPGDLIKYNLDVHRTQTPFVSVNASSAGAGVAANTDNTLDTADLPAGATKYTVPLIFVSISASALNARAGGRYEISLVGISQSGATLDTTKWVVERVDASKALRFVIIPFIRVKDTILPQVAAFGAVTTDNDALVVRVRGAEATETVQVVLPGQDSQEMRDFLKLWNINA